MDNQPWHGPTSSGMAAGAGTDSDWPLKDTVLDLLLPEALAPEMPPKESDRKRIQYILCEALEAFTLRHAECRDRIAALLGDMERPTSDPAAVQISGLPLTPSQAADYDRFFRVNRVSSTEPAQVVLRSFLQVALAVTDLFCRAPDFSETSAKAQFAGFAAQTRLFARCFGVECTR